MKKYKSNLKNDHTSKKRSCTIYHDKVPAINPSMSCLSSSGNLKRKQLNSRMDLQNPLTRKPLTYWTRQSATMVRGSKSDYLWKIHWELKKYFAALSQLKSLHIRLSIDIKIERLRLNSHDNHSYIFCQTRWNAVARTREILVFAASFVY